jgi:imidazole glycerol-phosphate synthase subunit HisH
MIVALIDYGSGNLRSAEKALARAAADSGIAAEIRVTADAADVARAERIVLPGVGAFADCMAGVRSIAGLEDALQEQVLDRGRPFLGICVGMELLATRGLEFGTHAGLDWIGGDVVPIEPADPALKVPHMGWNDLTFGEPRHAVLAKLPEGSEVYFVHSYRFAAAQPQQVLARTDYGGEIAAVVGRDNIVGTQFHPEKSQKVGLELLANFLRWRP